MKTLLATLRAYDAGMLPALAQVWAVDSKRLAADALLPALQEAMLDKQKVEAVWDKLAEAERSALQLLVSMQQGRMKVAQFERLYGKIRKLGRAQIEREKPQQQASSSAETLYYRGFIGEGYDRVGDALIGFVYIPSDLIAALPLHKTSYENLDAEVSPPAAEALPAFSPLDIIETVDDFRPADTTIVDDMTSLLAWLQATPAEIEGGQFASAEDIMPLLLRRNPIRLAFMLGIGNSAKLIARQEGRASPRRDEARQWLGASRAEQIRALASAWLESQSWRDMWHVPGLYPDNSSWSYDATAVRGAVLNLFADLLPDQGWVSLNDLIEIIKEFEPDFQRPDGDYDSWYIRNDAGEYLSGFESWDAVEGSLIEFYIVGPMHWLGLVDVGDDVLRLTAYGRAFLQISPWPALPPEPPPRIEARNDGSLLASRRVNRFDRFQLARFARCLRAADPYVYSIDAAGLQRAAAQGISVKHIQAFLSRQLAGRPLPLPLLKLLRNWQDGVRTTVSLESLVVLRATSEETVDKIFAFPAFRRYLGARLGPLACVVRAGEWEALRAKLSENAIDVDIERLSLDDAGQD